MRSLQFCKIESGLHFISNDDEDIMLYQQATQEDERNSVGMTSCKIGTVIKEQKVLIKKSQKPVQDQQLLKNKNKNKNQIKVQNSKKDRGRVKGLSQRRNEASQKGSDYNIILLIYNTKERTEPSQNSQPRATHNVRKSYLTSETLSNIKSRAQNARLSSFHIEALHHAYPSPTNLTKCEDSSEIQQTRIAVKQRR